MDFGNPDAIRSRARRLRQIAEEADTLATRVAAGQSVTWHGVAKDAYIERLAKVAQQVADSRDSVLSSAAARVSYLDDFTWGYELTGRCRRRAAQGPVADR